MCRRPILGLVLVAAIAAVSAADQSKSSWILGQFSTDDAPPWTLATTVWGRPLRGGAIDVLLIAPVFTLRDGVELARRLDLRVETAPVWQQDRLAPPPGHAASEAGLEEWAAALVKQLEKRHDVVIAANFDFTLLPAEVVAALIEKVEGGTGLVLSRYGTSLPAALQAYVDSLSPLESTRPVTRGIGEELTQEWRQGIDFVHLFEDKGERDDRHKGGRVADLAHWGEPPLTHCLVPGPGERAWAKPMFFDSYLSLAARAVRWAAKREPALWIEAIEDAGPRGPDELEIPPFLPREFIQRQSEMVYPTPLRPYVVHFNQSTKRRYTLRVQVRYPSRGIQWRGLETSLPKNTRTHMLQVPLGQGDCLLDIWLVDNKGVVDWYTEALQVDGWPKIANFHCSRFAIQPNDSLEVSLEVHPNLQRPRPCTVYIRAIDPLGRVVAEQYLAISPEGGRIETLLDVVDLIATSVRIEAFAADVPTGPFRQWQLEHSAYASTFVLVRQRGEGVFSFVADSAASLEFNARALCRTLSGIGVDTIHTPPEQPLGVGLALENLRILPHVAAYPPQTAQGGLVRDPCLTLPTFRRDENRSLNEQAATLWPLGSGLYSLGEGNGLAAGSENVCQSATCIDGFQKALRAAYPSLPRLNSVWGTTFRSWRNVSPMTSAEVESSGSFAPWLDFRRYMERVFTDAHTAGQGVIRTVDPGARVGFCTLPSPGVNAGYDWWLLASRLDLLGLPLDRCTIEKVRSYQSPGAFNGIRFTGDMAGTKGARARWLPWYAAFHDLAGVWIDGSYGTARNTPSSPALAPDGSAAPWLVSIGREMAELKTGIAALLKTATRENSGIALYGSQSSFLLNSINKDFNCDSAQAEGAFLRLLEGLGYQFDFVSYASAIEGGLDGYKVLILPMVRALSTEEVNALRDFNVRGGVLIADLCPGQFDEHGAPRAYPPLAEVFGIRHQGPVKASPESPPEPVGGAIGKSGRSKKEPWPAVMTDLSVESSGAVPMGTCAGAPIWLVRREGAGMTVLINHPIPALAGTKDFQELFRGWLEEAEAREILSGARAEDVPFSVERVKYRYGKADLMGFLRDPEASEESEKLRLRFDDERFAYNLRAGTPLPGGGRTQLKLKRGEAALFSVLPYEVTRLVLDVPANVPAGGRLPIHITVKTREALPGNHIVHITLAPKGGPVLRHYNQTIECLAGQGDTYIPLAYNDPVGPYTLTVHDVLTGIEEKLEVIVQSRQFF